MATSYNNKVRGEYSRGRSKKNREFANGNRDDKRKRPKLNDSGLDDNSPIIKSFRIFQVELDSRNDRYERIVKLSRDITIESKRIIFLLQRVAGSEDKDVVLSEALEKIQELNSTKFLELAQELDTQDPFQFLRAYSPGLQEYIEAVTFYHYLASEKLVGVEKIQSDLTFSVPVLSPSTSHSSNVQSTIEKMTDLATSDNESQCPSNEGAITNEGGQDTIPKCEVNRHLSVHIPPTEYMLGVGDFTGELMRMAINSVGAGDLEKPSVVATMMRIINDAFTTFAHPPRELRQKTRVLRQSLQKVETACYTLKVRGSEIPNHMLADVFSMHNSGPVESFSEELDEAYD